MSSVLLSKTLAAGGLPAVRATTCAGHAHETHALRVLGTPTHCQAAPLIDHPDPEGKHDFAAITVVEGLGRVAERVDVDAAVQIPRAELARRVAHRHRQESAHIKVAKRRVAVRALVIVVEAEAQLDRDSDGRLATCDRPARSDAELEIRALARSAVS